jgi:hypothetical protein
VRRLTSYRNWGFLKKFATRYLVSYGRHNIPCSVILVGADVRRLTSYRNWGFLKKFETRYLVSYGRHNIVCSAILTNTLWRF